MRNAEAEKKNIKDRKQKLVEELEYCNMCGDVLVDNVCFRCYSFRQQKNKQRD